jgi:hypothetical protein
LNISAVHTAPRLFHASNGGLEFSGRAFNQGVIRIGDGDGVGQTSEGVNLTVVKRDTELITLHLHIFGQAGVDQWVKFQQVLNISWQLCAAKGDGDGTCVWIDRHIAAVSGRKTVFFQSFFDFGGVILNACGVCVGDVHGHTRNDHRTIACGQACRQLKLRNLRCILEIDGVDFDFLCNARFELLQHIVHIVCIADSHSHGVRRANLDAVLTVFW